MLFLNESGEFISKFNEAIEEPNFKYQIVLDWVGEFDDEEEKSEYENTASEYEKEYDMHIQLSYDDETMSISTDSFESICKFLTDKSIYYINSMTDSLYTTLFELYLDRKPTDEELEIVKKYDKRDTE